MTYVTTNRARNERIVLRLKGSKKQSVPDGDRLGFISLTPRYKGMRDNIIVIAALAIKHVRM